MHALLAKLDAPIIRYPLRSMLISAAIGLPLLLAAGFFHLTFEEGRAAGKAMSWWEGQGMTAKAEPRKTGAAAKRKRPKLAAVPAAAATADDAKFDRLIYERKRMEEIFEFDYQLEMYKPVAKRRWGYFALPILSGDRLVGKLDATSDRRAGVLRVDAIHQDEPFDDKTAAAVRAEIEDLARWLELDLRLPE